MLIYSPLSNIVKSSLTSYTSLDELPPTSSFRIRSGSVRHLKNILSIVQTGDIVRGVFRQSSGPPAQLPPCKSVLERGRQIPTSLIPVDGYRPFPASLEVSLKCLKGACKAMSVENSFGFSKLRTCPSSNVLNEFARRALAVEERQIVKSHLHRCDFCGAELRLLKRNAAHDVPPRLARIPLALLLLAEMSLPKKHLLRRGRPLASPGK